MFFSISYVAIYHNKKIVFTHNSNFLKHTKHGREVLIMHTKTTEGKSPSELYLNSNQFDTDNLTGSDTISIGCDGGHKFKIAQGKTTSCALNTKEKELSYQENANEQYNTRQITSISEPQTKLKYSPARNQGQEKRRAGANNTQKRPIEKLQSYNLQAISQKQQNNDDLAVPEIANSSNNTTEYSTEVKCDDSYERLKQLVKNGDYHALQKVLDSNVSLSFIFDDGVNLLHVAALFDQPVILEMLINRGLRSFINDTDKNDCATYT